MKKMTHFVFALLTLTVTNLYAQDPSFDDCDDFTDSLDYPTLHIFHLDLEVGDTVGYTQGGTQTITIGDQPGGPASFDIFPDFGIFSGGQTLNFSFDGTDQHARFHLDESSALPSPYRSFSINGSDYVFMDTLYPIVVDGVTVDIDTSTVPDSDVYYGDIFIIFSGALTEVSLRSPDFHESAIKELCIALSFDAEACDYFEDTDLFPTASYSSEELVGYTQDESQAITVGTDASVWVNEFESGIYGVGPLDFDFDGSDQAARFLMYGFTGQFNEMGFSINGEPLVYLDETFPMTIAGVEVDLDLSPADIDDWEYFYLTFSGEIEVISQELFESGITELCVETEDADDTGIETLKKPQVSIYPNPTGNYLRVDSEETIEEIAIYSLSGQEIINQTVGNTITELDLSEIVPGIYLIKITSQNGSETIEKLIRE